MPVAGVDDIHISPYKMCNVTDGITQQPHHITIYSFILLSYVVGVDAWLGTHCDFFLFRWENLGGPPPY